MLVKATFIIANGV